MLCSAPLRQDAASRFDRSVRGPPRLRIDLDSRGHAGQPQGERHQLPDQSGCAPARVARGGQVKIGLTDAIRKVSRSSRSCSESSVAKAGSIATPSRNLSGRGRALSETARQRGATLSTRPSTGRSRRGAPARPDAAEWKKSFSTCSKPSVTPLSLCLAPPRQPAQGGANLLDHGNDTLGQVV
jgi:hypothetical protein